MDEYISREAILELFYDWRDDLNQQMEDSVKYPVTRYGYKICRIQLDDCIDAVKEFDAADVVEVVRCKDCVHFVGMGNIPFLVCEIGRDGSRNYGGDFCSRGVRKEP